MYIYIFELSAAEYDHNMWEPEISGQIYLNESLILLYVKAFLLNKKTCYNFCTLSVQKDQK